MKAAMMSQRFQRMIALLPCILLYAGSPQADPRNLPVPRATIYAGDTITAALMTERLFEVRANMRSGVIEQASEIVGKVARRTLLPGQVIPLNAVRPPDLVRQGRPAAAIYQADGLTITMQVLPMQPGMAGDYIAVQNSDSGVVIKGTVLPDGSISVSAP